MAVENKREIRTIGELVIFVASYVFLAAPFSYASVRCVGDTRGRAMLGNRGVVAVSFAVDQDAEFRLSEKIEGHNDLSNIVIELLGVVITA